MTATLNRGTATETLEVGVDASHEAGEEQRTLVSYLLMPRPKDLVKGLLIVVTYLVLALSVGEVSIASIGRMLLVAAAVELLIYPARYQWNDIRGFVSDQRHPDCAARGRLPGPIGAARSRVLVSGVVAVCRLTLVAVLIVKSGSDVSAVLVFATAGVFGVAILYEVLRSAFTGRAEHEPVRIPGVVAIWLTVGAGYAVRGGIGLALAIDVKTSPVLATFAAITLWAYGVAFVTSRWAVEATAFAIPRDGHVEFRARPDQAREHLLLLTRWLPDRLDDCSDVKRWVPLRQHTSLIAPWNAAMMFAGGAAAVTGRLLGGPASWLTLTIVGCAGALAAVALLTTPRARVPVYLGAGLFLLACLFGTQSLRPGWGVVPWLLTSAAYLFFSSRSLHALGSPSVASRAFHHVTRRLGSSVMGQATWEAVSGTTDVAAKADSSTDAIELVDVARLAAAAGAREAMRWWGRLDELAVEEKCGPRDLVSRADRTTETVIRDVLGCLRPGDGFLGEESGVREGDGEIRWIVDPIDGTTSFLYGRADWAVSVAAVRCSDDVVLAAAVVEPVLGRTTTARRGGGTHHEHTRTRVNDVISMEEALVEVNLGTDEQRAVAGHMVRELALRVRDVRRGGSAAAALAHVATGRADAVWAPGLKPWDCAAGVLLVEEAGGSVGDLTQPTPGVVPPSGDVLAANPALCSALRTLLQPIYGVSPP